MTFSIAFFFTIESFRLLLQVVDGITPCVYRTISRSIRDRIHCLVLVIPTQSESYTSPSSCTHCQHPPTSSFTRDHLRQLLVDMLQVIIEFSSSIDVFSSI